MVYTQGCEKTTASFYFPEHGKMDVKYECTRNEKHVEADMKLKV